MTWPPRWTGPQFKEQTSGKIERHKRRAEWKTREDKEKKKVRLRDKVCRFPLCGCKRFGLALHVSHLQHKGMGGNPKGDRSVPELMILLCVRRHQEGRIAIHRGTLRWVALTEAGAEGPIKWEIDGDALQPFGEIPRVADVFIPHGWLTVARERKRGQLDPLEDWQRVILIELAKMSC